MQELNEEVIEVYSNTVEVKVLPEPPVIVDQSESHIACCRGTDVVIFCNVDCYPEAEFQWLKENEFLCDQTSNRLEVSFFLIMK